MKAIARSGRPFDKKEMAVKAGPKTAIHRSGLSKTVMNVLFKKTLLPNLVPNDFQRPWLTSIRKVVS